MKSNYLYLSGLFEILIVSISFFTISCSKDDESLCNSQNVGEFHLLENSISCIPYGNDLKLIFQDSIGNQVSLIFDYNNGGFGSIENDFVTSCEYDNLLEKVYHAKYDFYKYNIFDEADSLKIKYYLYLYTNPFSREFGNTKISDQLAIYERSVRDTTTFFSEFSILVNRRDLSMEEEIQYFPQSTSKLILFNKSFTNIYSNNKSTVFYSFELGLIAFRDHDNKLWVLDHTESINH